MAKTIRDIAQLAGVSDATVSRVLNGSSLVKPQTREIVLKIIKKYNFTPNEVARNLSKNTTNTIGVVIPDITNPFFAEIIRGISTVLRKNDFNIVMSDTEENCANESAAIKMLQTQKVRGILFTPTIDSEAAIQTSYMEDERNRIPIVFVDRGLSSRNFDGVFLDNVQTGFLATEALIKEGHTNIAVIAGPKTSRTAIDRVFGYQMALKNHKILYNEKNILHYNYCESVGNEIIKKILSLTNPPTALFTASCSLTKAVIAELLRHGYCIPADYAIIGLDPMLYTEPFGLSVSYIDRSVTFMGESAATLLLERLTIREHSNTAYKHIIIPPKLVLRGSEKLIKKIIPTE